MALHKYKREQELKEEFVPKCSAKTQKASKAREPVTKKDLDQHSPTIFEIQRDENGALKVVTSKDDSGREKKMVWKYWIQIYFLPVMISKYLII